MARSFKVESFIEIGPGLGALTEPLAQIGKPLTLIELDKGFSELWREKGFKVIEADALQVDWKELAIAKPIGLVSNLPYQISSSLVIDRSIEPCGVECMLLMFQKEVAQRLLARKESKEYGLLSVIAQVFWKMKKVFEVSSKDFYPPPAVASQVVLFERRDLAGSPRFLSLVKAAFAQRRKFLIKNISGLAAKDQLEKIFADLGLDSKVRAENLSPEDFWKLHEALRK